MVFIKKQTNKNGMHLVNNKQDCVFTRTLNKFIFACPEIFGMIFFPC